MSHHNERVAEVVAHEAAHFITLEASKDSLITVTRAVPAARGERMTVFVSVFPEDKMRAALAFLDRKRADFSDHLKKHSRLRPLPRIDFLPDSGEKNRQRLDELSAEL